MDYTPNPVMEYTALMDHTPLFSWLNPLLLPIKPGTIAMRAGSTEEASEDQRNRRPHNLETSGVAILHNSAVIPRPTSSRFNRARN